MAAPPIGLGYCETCKYYDVDKALCRVGAPATTLEGRWPRCLPTDWCGAWESPTALVMEIACSPGQVARMSGPVEVAVFAEGPGQFVAGDVVRFNAVDQATTWVSAKELRFTLDTNQAAANYPVRVYRASETRLSRSVVFQVT